MEFNRKVDANSSYLQTPSSTFAVDRTLNGGIMSNSEQKRREIVGESSELNTEEFIRREMEKKRIRGEILAAEYLRRRELEEEVIKNLVLEGEIPIQVLQRFLMGSEIRDPVLNGLGFGSSLALAVSGSKDSGVNGRLQLVNQIEAGIALAVSGSGSGSKDSGVSGRDVGGSVGLAFQRQPEATTTGVVIKPLINLQKNAPVKPVISNASTASLKRKWETPTVANSEETPLAIGTKKKSRVKWMCDLCEVRATCEENLKAHLKGKKHKLIEKELKKATLAKTNNNNKKLSDSSPLPEKIKEIPKVPSPLPLETKVLSSVPKVYVKPNSSVPQKSKFWCTSCNVGATSEAQMNEHRKGYKHKKLIKEQAGGS